jgi:hypothetical protein
MEPDPQYRHDLPSAERARATYDVPRELLERVWRHGAATRKNRTSITTEAIAEQVLGWIAAEVACVDPATGREWVKPPGEPFPERSGLFARRAHGATPDRGETVRLTIRLDPRLMEDWQNGVWQQLHIYHYPAYALQLALEEYLERAGQD